MGSLTSCPQPRASSQRPFPSTGGLPRGLQAPPDRALPDRSLAQSLWALFTSSLTISLVFAVIPFCRNVKVLASVMALAGLAMGCIDTVANMQLVRIYQKDSAIFLQVSPRGHELGVRGPVPLSVSPSPSAQASGW